MATIEPWIQTYTGKQFYPLDPDYRVICIEDIAHSLSMKCRYGGHCLRFYSVAEHSVHISRAVSAEHALWGLLHDAAEAYLADIPSPVKHLIPGWKEIENKVQIEICKKFDLDFVEPPEVKLADKRIISNERDALMLIDEGKIRAWTGTAIQEPLPGVGIQAWSPLVSECKFLMHFDALTRMKSGDKYVITA